MHLRRRVASSTAAVLAVAFSLVLWPAAVSGAETLFVGDYSTGDFSGWPTVQAKNYNDSGKAFVPTYSASIVWDALKGNVARFEVRPGDVPPFGGGERSEVQGGLATGGVQGQTRWYQFSTMFDPSFPLDHADLGWGVTNQWHSLAGGSPPISWTVDMTNGYWSLTLQKQSAPGVYLGSYSIFDTPLNPGQWHDVTMEIGWSTSEDTGLIRLWLNGVRQNFSDGSDTYRTQTLIPGTTAVYYKEGMYRNPVDVTDIVFHTGFRSSDSELAPAG